jgi:hypothetical protein
MRFNPKGLLLTAAYAALLILALRTDTIRAWDLAARTVTWAVLLLVTAATVTSMIRRRRFEPLGPRAAFREIGRWFHAIRIDF